MYMLSTYKHTDIGGGGAEEEAQHSAGRLALLRQPSSTLPRSRNSYEYHRYSARTHANYRLPLAFPLIL